jgi:hypothetical protein
MPQPDADPGEVISNRELRELYRSFLDSIRRLHPDVQVEVNHMETWLRLDDTVLGRIVAYRELFHVQIGQDNVWEIRIRNRAACLETMDRILSRFLKIYARRATRRVV